MSGPAQPLVSAPFNEHVELTVTTAEDGTGVATVGDGEHFNNHVGSRHAGALFAMCEGAARGAVAARAADASAAELLTCEIAYTRMARGPIEARAEIVDVAEDPASVGPQLVEVRVSAADEAGHVVATADMTWRVAIL